MAKLKIGMCTSSSKLDDSSFLFSAWSGLKKAREHLEIESLVVEAEDDGDIDRTLSYLAENAFDLIWAIGFNMHEAVVDVARQHPTNKFASVDVSTADLPPNLLSVRFKEEEGSFLVGYLAAKVSSTKKIAFLGGMDVDLIRKFQYGYMAGARAAACDVSVLCRHADSFLSYERGRSLAKELYDEGCDILFHAAGSAGKGAIRYARDEDKLVIGCDIDQSFLAPSNILTSMTKQVDTVIYSVSESFVQGTFNGGSAIHLGIADGVVGYAPIHHPSVSTDLNGELERLSERISRGELSIPTSKAEYDAGSRR